MRIQVASDLHLEFLYSDPFNELYKMLSFTDADVLVLAGDIHSDENKLIKILNYLAERYKHVIYVPGNHDYWGKETYKLNLAFQTHSLAGNIHFLDNKSITIDEKVFYGGCMWSHLTKQQLIFFPYLLNDFRKIRDLDINEEHDHFIRNMVKDADIIISHFLPFPQSISSRYFSQETNDYFCARLDPLHYSCKYWIHGHTHDSKEYETRNGIKVICNPYGYPGREENYSFNKELVITI